MKQACITSSAAQTKRLGQILAKKALKKRARKTAFVIGLEGELGGGKTTFLQGFAKGLDIGEKILSPTFVIMKKFLIYPAIQPGAPSNTGSETKGKYLYHIDCYRLKKPKELLDLGFQEIISNSKNIVVIEWADKIKKIMPKHTLWINFCFINEQTRKITTKV